MEEFIFKKYYFEKSENSAHFEYGYKNGPDFKEVIRFAPGQSDYDEELLDRALKLAFVLSGTSYYKTFPTREVLLGFDLDENQANFFSTVYQEGMSQFAFENNLTRDDLAHFHNNKEYCAPEPVTYNGSGILALQSGGKDSLLLTSLMLQKNAEFHSWYVLSGGDYPDFLKNEEFKLLVATRQVDREGLVKARDLGAKNGHIPITYIMQSLALIQAIILNKSIVLMSIAHEGEEPHSQIGDLKVNHQWSKTWAAEQLFVDYVKRYLSFDIKIGSPLRTYSELKVAELFSEVAWEKYAPHFSSCNLANYKHFEDRSSRLTWCCDCPKCANTFLLFAPFINSQDLRKVFNGKDLFSEPSLTKTYKGLLGIDGFTKPLECISEVEELRRAYHMAQARGGYSGLPFAVPESDFDYQTTYPVQAEIAEIIG